MKSLETGTRKALKPPVEAIDGRRLRADHSRKQIIAAVLDLVKDGDPEPAADVVAAKAGVGVRTVYRLFGDSEGLIREIGDLVRLQVQAIAEVPVADDDWTRGFADTIERRVLLYEAIGPFNRASHVHRHRSAQIRRDLQAQDRVLRGLIEARLPPDLRDDPTLLDALDLLLSPESWTRLRQAQALGVEEAKLVLRTLVGQALASRAR